MTKSTLYRIKLGGFHSFTSREIPSMWLETQQWPYLLHVHITSYGFFFWLRPHNTTAIYAPFATATDAPLVTPSEEVRGQWIHLSAAVLTITTALYWLDGAVMLEGGAYLNALLGNPWVWSGRWSGLYGYEVWFIRSTHIKSLGLLALRRLGLTTRGKGGVSIANPKEYTARLIVSNHFRDTRNGTEIELCMFYSLRRFSSSPRLLLLLQPVMV